MTRKLPIFRLGVIKQLVRIANHGDPAMPWTKLCRALTRPSKRRWAFEFEPVFSQRYPGWVHFMREETPDGRAFRNLYEKVVSQWLKERPWGPESSGSLRSWAQAAWGEMLCTRIGKALHHRYREWEEAQFNTPRARRNVVVG